MAHELDFTKGKPAFATYKQKAWHSLGRVLTKRPETVEELMEVAGLDYEVEKAPNIHRLPNGHEIESKSSFFTYRKDTIQNIDHYKVLGANVGDGYTIVQNEEALGILEPFFDNETILFETAGAIRNGSRTFVTCKTKDPIVIDGKDEVDNYFVVFNSHDGSLSLMAYFTPVRIVCNNTLQMSFHNAKRQIKLKHTTNVKNKLETATKILLQADKNAEAFKETAQAMKKAKWTERKFFDYLANVFCTPEELNKMGTGEHPLKVLSTRKQNVITDVLNFAHGGVGQREATPGSAWWAYNAVTGYYANAKNFQSPEKKMQSLLFGGSDKTMTKALALAKPNGKIKPLGTSLN